MIVGTKICFVVDPCSNNLCWNGRSNNHCWNNCFNNDCWNKHLFCGCSLFQQPLLRESVTQQGVAAGMLITYPKLPCSPYSPAWKGSAMIRGVLTKMLAMAMVVVAPRRCWGWGSGKRDNSVPASSSRYRSCNTCQSAA